jgi:hypothetical protein
VTYEITGTWNIQRFTGIAPATGRGHGLGDLTFDGWIEGNDLDEMIRLIQASNRAFNPAADLNADGWLTISDWSLLGGELSRLHDLGLLAPNGSSPLVSQGTLDYYASLSATAVPEPTTFAAFATFTTTINALSRRRRCRRPSCCIDNLPVDPVSAPAVRLKPALLNPLLSEVML